MLITFLNACQTWLKVIIFFIFITHVAFAAPGNKISFDEAVRYALNNNPRMNVTNATIDAANATVTEERGKGLPKLNVEMNAARSNNPLSVFGYKLSQGNASFADFGADQYHGVNTLNVKPNALDSPGYYNNINTGVVVKIPIFSGGSHVANINKAKYLVSEARHGNQAARNELIYDVLQAYEGIHVANRLIDVAKDGIHAADIYLQMTNSLYRQSIVIKSDVLLAESNRRSAEMTLISAQAELNNQLDAFRLLIGKPNSNVEAGSSVVISLPNAALTELKRRALFNNPQLRSLKSKLNASKSEITVANASNWPQVDLQVRHDWNANTFALNGASNSAFLEFNWELFSSGSQYGAGKHALAQYNQVVAELDNHSNDIELAVAQAKRSAQTAELQLKSSILNAESAKKSEQLLRQLYGRGVTPLGQVLEAQSRLNSAKAQSIISRYNMILARARLLVLLNEFKFSGVEQHHEVG